MEFSLSSFLSQHFPPINFNVTVQQKKNANDFEWSLYLFFSVLFLDFFLTWNQAFTLVNKKNQRNT